MKIGLKKTRIPAYDPTVVSFDSIPACDGQTDGHAAYVCVAL